MANAPACAREALDMVRAGLGYLAAADAAQLADATQAECLKELEQDAAVLTAARAWILAAFTAGQGYADDADYSAVSWLIYRTGITKGAAAGHSAWAKRAATHPRSSTGTMPTRCWSRPRPRGWAWRSWHLCSRRCTSGPAATCPIRTPTGTSKTAP